jgi:hypothetical protein
MTYIPTDLAKALLEVAPSASLVATGAGLAALAVSKTIAQLWDRKSEAKLTIPETPLRRDGATPWRVARERVVLRLRDATSYRAEQLSTRRWSRVAANSLTIAQYIIGGVLASSFVQAALSPRLVGGLGVLVLIASLFKQQFHPEIDAEEARRKASKLQGLIRVSEDQLAILDAKTATGQDHSDALIALLTQITGRLTGIENPEATESKLQTSDSGMRPSQL